MNYIKKFLQKIVFNSKSSNIKLDYTLKTNDVVWFSYKINPKDESCWIEAKILDLNWHCKAAAVQLNGYVGVTCCSISSLHRQKKFSK